MVVSSLWSKYKGGFHGEDFHMCVELTVMSCNYDNLQIV